MAGPRGGWKIESYQDGFPASLVWVWEPYIPPALTEKLNGLPLTGKGNWRKAENVSGDAKGASSAD